MDLAGYAEQATALLNADLDGEDALRALLASRPALAARVSDRDCMVLRRLQRELRPVFAAAAADDDAAVVAGLNDLLRRHPVTPQISDHDPAALHLHVGAGTSSVADLLTGEALLGLATLVCDLGPRRLGTCAAAPCTAAYVDTSPNASRRYCSARCSSRASVAAHRARLRAGRVVVE